MKYLILLGDGMADLDIPELGNRTPIEVADTPLFHSFSKRGILGTVKTVPDGMSPGSDVANLSLMGYDTKQFYTGRSPLEAASIGIDLKPTDLALRCNLVTLSEDESYENKTMLDYSAGEISSKEAKVLIEEINRKLGSDIFSFYAGTSYRNCLVISNGEKGTLTTPPHDISSKQISQYLPKEIYGDVFLNLMKQSYEILKNHPINVKRKQNGLKPANSIWLWGEGRKPSLVPFFDIYNKKAGVISAVDLIKGIGICASMKILNVEGATGTLSTNYENKAQACIDGFIKDDLDFIYLHVEASDECGHQGDLQGKILAIENLDKRLLSLIVFGLESAGVDLTIMVLPDHPTPISLRTHTASPVPFFIYAKSMNNNNEPYSERACKKSNLYFNNGVELLHYFFNV